MNLKKNNYLSFCYSITLDNAASLRGSYSLERVFYFFVQFFMYNYVLSIHYGSVS